MRDFEMRYHLDTDFLIYALSNAGPERKQLLALAESDAEIQISSIAWYEFVRGPRTPDQISIARSFFFEDGIIPFSEALASLSGEIFRQLGSPRRKSADIPIGVTAAAMDAVLLTRNSNDFAGIPDLKVEDFSD